MTRSPATPAREDGELRSTIDYLLGIVVAFVGLWLFGPLAWPDGWEVLVSLSLGGVVGHFIRRWRDARLKRAGSA